MSAYPPVVSTRSLFAVLIALAMLLAPTVMGAGAVAAAPDQGMVMMDHSGHCQAPIGGSADHQKSDGKSCCVAMCVALAVTPSTPGEAAPISRQAAQFASPKAYHGLLAEIATPPPRNA